MVPLFKAAETILAITRLTRTTIDIPTKSIPSRRILQRQIRLTLRTRQSMMAAEMGIGAIPMQALRATPAALDRNTALTATLDHRLPAPAADHPREAEARLRVRIPHLLVRVRHRPDPQTQAAVRPDQAPVLRHRQLRHNQLPRRRPPHRIQMQVPLDRPNKGFTLTKVEQCSGLLDFACAPLFYTALRAKQSRPGTKTA
jgi:hypothetical protein